MAWHRSLFSDILFLTFTIGVISWGIFMIVQIKQMVFSFRKKITMMFVIMQYVGLLSTCVLVGYFIYENNDDIPDKLYNSWICAPLLTGLQLWDSIIFTFLTNFRLFMVLDMWRIIVGSGTSLLFFLVVFFNFLITVSFVAILTTAREPSHQQGMRSCIQIDAVWLSILFILLGPFFIAATCIFLWPYLHYLLDTNGFGMNFTIRTSAVCWSCCTVSNILRWCYFVVGDYGNTEILIHIANCLVVNILMFGAFSCDQKNHFSRLMNKIVGKRVSKVDEENAAFKRRLVNRLMFLQEQDPVQRNLPGIPFEHNGHLTAAINNRRFSGSIPTEFNCVSGEKAEKSGTPTEVVSSTGSLSAEKELKRHVMKHYAQPSLSNISMTRSRDTIEHAPDSEQSLKPPVFNTLPFNNWRQGYIILPLCIIPKIDNIRMFLELADGTFISTNLTSVIPYDLLRSKIVMDQKLINALAKKHKFKTDEHVLSVEEWEYFKLFKSFYREDWQDKIYE